MTALHIPVRLERSRRPAITRLLLIVFLLASWEVWGRLGDPLFAAPPSEVALSVFDILADPKLVAALELILLQIGAAFVASVALGLIIGLGFAISRVARWALYPIMFVIFTIPQAPFLPLLTLLFGISSVSKIVFGVTHAVFPMVVAVTAGVDGVDANLVKVAHSMGASKLQIVRSVILPSIFENIFTGMRLAMSGLLVGVVLAELFVSNGGIGFYARQFADLFEPEKLFAVVLILASIATLINELCRYLELLLVKWRCGLAIDDAGRLAKAPGRSAHN